MSDHFSEIQASEIQASEIRPSEVHPPEIQAADAADSFQEALSQFEKSHTRKRVEPGKGREGTVIAVTADSVFLDIGFKTEGVLALAELESAGQTSKPGDKLQVNIKGRDPEGYYELTLGRAARLADWTSLEKAFAEKTPILGTVTGVVKGGLSVNIGVRAFMPASRSGARDAAEMEKLIEQEIRCRIIKLDATEEDVVVDRRGVSEEEESAAKDRRYSELKEGDTVTGTVRSLADYGAFVEIGGTDALLHVSDISWGRVASPADVLSVGQPVTVQVLKIDPEKRRISVGLKQLQAHPWDAVQSAYQPGERVRGTVTRVVDFGAFVELAPGIEGLIHISEMSWAKRVRKASDAVKPGDTVEVVILGVSAGDRRISLGLKQALGDPWLEVSQRFPVGSVAEGPVVSVTKFGAFVQLSEGVEGMIHISDMSAEKRINHPQDVVRLGQTVRAQVLEVDTGKRRLRLGMKQLVPTSIDEYIAEHNTGDTVTGRVMEVSGLNARVELGEGIQGNCHITTAPFPPSETAAATDKNNPGSKADVSSLSSMLQARWKGGASEPAKKQEEIHAGQVRSFTISGLDREGKKIELGLA